MNIKVSQLKVGAKVKGSDGKWKRVTGISPWGTWRLITIDSKPDGVYHQDTEVEIQMSEAKKFTDMQEVLK